MGLHHRKLGPDCEFSCQGKKPCPPNCDSDDDCHQGCYYPPPPPPPASSSKHKITPYLIISLSIVAAAFLVLFCYAIYVKFRNKSRRRRALSRQQTEDDDFVVDEEEHGPMAMVDHPIWYIRTTGLQQSIISAITVCKYKKGEGLIEGTECSVCLGEFEEDESLRLLPKCNHAFHLPCIDTWLSSHTSCPMCRAPIVTHPSRIPSAIMEPNVLDSSSVMENSGESETSGGMEDGVAQLRNGEEEEEGQEVEDEGRRVCEAESSASEVVNMQPRRSVSLDSSAAAKINLALSIVLPVESHGNSNRHQVGEVNEQIVSKRVDGNRNSKGGSSSRSRYLQSAPSPMKRSRSFNGKHILSWYSRSQKKPNAPLRSF